MESFLAQATVYLLAAVVAVPIAKRFGFGSVLGYLLAGAVIGPFGLGWVGSEGQDVMHFAEFGVVLMLFVIGLELRPSLLWRMRGPILGLGGLQVGVTAALVASIAALGFGLAWGPAAAVGMTLALSSTAIVLQTLNEKGLLKTQGGQSSFSVLLFQDIAVIPMLAIMPLLAVAGGGAGGREDPAPAVDAADPAHAAGSGSTAGAEHAAEAGHAAVTWIAGFPPWLQTLIVLGAVAAIVVGGRMLVRPAFRALGRARMREIFTAAALLLVIATALLMTRVGLSPALGTFLAGVVLADSEYRHELESDLEPFKGLLLGLFFIAVGASLDFGLIASEPGLILGIAGGLIALKFGVLIALARAFSLRTDQALLFAFALPQAGEFAFVLFSFANQEGVLGREITDPLVAVVAVSMALTPILLILNERLIQPRFGTRQTEDRPADEIDEESAVLIAGFGGFGATVGRLLRANGIRPTVLDIDSDRVDLLRRLGLEVYYGDATRHDLLHTAGADRARLLVVALDSPEKTLEVVDTARRHFPGLTILARAFDWQDAHDLQEAGVDHVYRESLDTALRMGTEALRLLGFRGYQAHRAAQKFLRHDEESLRTLTEERKQDRDSYIGTARQRIRELEDMLLADLQDTDLERDVGWDPESLREEARRLGRPVRSEPTVAAGEDAG